MTRVEWDGRSSRHRHACPGDPEVDAISGTSATAISTSTTNPSRLRRQRGASLVEMALAFPLLVILLFGVVDFGWMFSTHHELRSASREGARLAVVDNGCYVGSPDYGSARCPTGNPSQQLTNLKADTAARATGLPVPGSLTVTVCYPAGAAVGTSNATVTLTYPGSSLSGLFGGLLNGITLRSSAVMRIEQLPTYNKDGSCP